MYKISGQKGPFRGWDRDHQESAQMGARPLFLTKRKEVCTQTSTAVLFISGANVETKSKCPASGKGGNRLQ